MMQTETLKLLYTTVHQQIKIIKDMYKLVKVILKLLIQQVTKFLVLMMAQTALAKVL